MSETKKEFEALLDNKTREAAAQKSIDWEAQKKEWLASVEKFYGDMEHWLKKYIDNGRITIEKGVERIQEEHIGKYQAASRVIKIGNDRVFLRPVGTLLLGARGRIDMEGPKATVKFILTGKHSDGIRISLSSPSKKNSVPESTKEPKAALFEEQVWKIATPPPNVQLIELTAESFFKSLIGVVNG